MKNIFSRILLSCFFLILPTGTFASASTVAEALNVTGNRPVTRAEFLQASVIVFGLPVDFTSPLKEYRRYPVETAPYVRAADRHHVLEVFGASTDLAQVITRGEALHIVAKMHEWKQTEHASSFRDVDSATDLGVAVNLAVRHAWMNPLRERVFGVDVRLRGKEARALLTRAANDAGEMPEQIVVTPLKRTTVAFESAKFRDQIEALLRSEYLYGEKVTTASGSTAKEFVASMHDPYTSLFDPAEARSFRTQLGGTVTGIGVHLSDKTFDVLSVVEKSPAERVGIKAGDQIISVNKKPVMGMGFEDVINRIRGKVGSPVRIGVRRGGEELSFDIVRALIDIPDTKVEIRSRVAIVTISQFGEHLIKDAPALFDSLAASDLDGIILDVRFNPGGYLQAVPSVLTELLPKDSVFLRTRGKNFVEDYVTTDDPSIPADLPVVVLVNESTASSAEIVAGALQDHERAVIVGRKTYGKGTVQTVVPFPNRASLKYTIAEWLTPDERPINTIGIIPDVDVEQSDAGDAQLERALEIIRASSR